MDAAERLSIIEDLRRLMASYVRFADHHRWQELAGLFTQDGTFIPYKPDGWVWLRMNGREEIATTMVAATATQRLRLADVEVSGAIGR